MTGWDIVATDADTLVNAIQSKTQRIAVKGEIRGLPALALSSGQTLAGLDDSAILAFANDGLTLAGDNRIENLALRSPADSRAILLSDAAPLSGQIAIERVRCIGVIDLTMQTLLRDAQIKLAEVTILSADATARLPRPYGNGVEVQQGALTIWNRSSTPAVLTVDASGINIGTPDAPVLGAGIFVAGSDGGGTVRLARFETGAVHSDSALPEGTTSTVSGAIFFLHGVSGDEVWTHGDVTTHGANAVPIDNWGMLDRWTVRGDARSYGPSAVGFVNAGTLAFLTIEGVLETFGDGARGCCVYQPMGCFAAQAIRTHGSAAVGVQIEARLERLHLSDGLATYGDAGEGLVKGTMVRTPAHGIEVGHNTALGELDCAAITVNGADAVPIDGRDRIERIVGPDYCDGA